MSLPRPTRSLPRAVPTFAPSGPGTEPATDLIASTLRVSPPWCCFLAARPVTRGQAYRPVKKGPHHACMARTILPPGCHLGRGRGELRPLLRVRHQGRVVPVRFPRRDQGDGADYPARTDRPGI